MGDTNQDDEASGLAGSLTGLFSIGADEHPNDPNNTLSVSLSSDTSGLPTLFSQGAMLSYDVNMAGDTLTGYVDEGDGMLGMGDRVVFTLTVNTDGSWNFDLDDQLDHVDDVGNGENFDLRTAADGSTFVASIDFSSVIQVTDYDGDTVGGLNAGDFTIAVQDDIPVRNPSTTPVSATVEEDGMSILTGDAGDLSEGNKEMGDTNQDDEASGLAGSLTGLFSIGADEHPNDPNNTLSVSLSSDTSGLPTLFSQGAMLSYDVNMAGDTLTGYVDEGDGMLGMGDRVVFTLTVNTDGSWNFDLDDQLDHVDDVGNGENFDLRTAADGSTFVASIDFSSVIQVTDYDGDTVGGLNAGDFTIAVQDDIPVRNPSTTPVSATVEEDGMFILTGDAGDLSEGNKEMGDTNQDDEASGLAGSLTGLFSIGADEHPNDPNNTLSVSLSSDTSGLPTLFSQGAMLSYDVNMAGDTLTGYVDEGDGMLGMGDRVVFTLTVNTDGSWNFDLDDQLDHVDDVGNGENFDLRTAADGSTFVASIDFSSVIQVTDYDGDTVGGLNA